MASFVTPYSNPFNYTYDPNKIEVTGGIARLKELNLWNDLILYYRFEELAWTGVYGEVLDSSPSLNHANAFDGAQTVINGHVGRAVNFDGANDYLMSTLDHPLLGNTAFSVSTWAYVPTGAAGSYGAYIAWGIESSGNGVLMASYGGNHLRLYLGFYDAYITTGYDVLTYDTWHHIVWTKEAGGGGQTGHSLYVDNIPRSFTPWGNAAPHIQVSKFFVQRGPGGTRFARRYQDELAVWSRVITQSEVGELNNIGNGKIIKRFAEDSPSIFYTTGHSDTIGVFSNFVANPGVVEGTLGYQLSEDGITWKYYDGNNWVDVVTNKYNIESTVKANIGTFPTAQDKIFVKTIMVSDATQQVEIDEIQITYYDNLVPNVDAGPNGAVKDNSIVKLFCCAEFNDPDGTVVKAYYKVDNGVDLWTEIPQGGHATLLEAVKDLDYQFINIGDAIVRLQVEDNNGSKAEDFKTITVEKYTKNINITDADTSNDIVGIQFSPGDGADEFLTGSPFTYAWEYGARSVVVAKEGYYAKKVDFNVIDENNLDIVLVKQSIINNCNASIGYLKDTNELIIIAWLEKGGGLVSSPTNCTINLKNDSHVVEYTNSSTSHNGGYFSFKGSNFTPSTVGYYLEVSIEADSAIYTTPVGANIIIPQTISFGDVWENILEEHDTPGTFGGAVNDLYNEAFGKWAIDVVAKTLTLYKIDGTVLQVFNLDDTVQNVPAFISRTPA